MCKYYGTHDHRTEDCRQLREEVARLFNKGYLREFLSDRAKNHFRNMDSNKQTGQEETEPQHIINMIIGGVDIAQGTMLKCTRISVTREKRTLDYIPEGALSFSDEDAKGIIQPHNDALVISILVNKTRVKRVSSANIIRSKVIEQLDLQDRIVSAVRVLNGFNMACETTKGDIILPVNTAEIVREAKFYVIEGDMSLRGIKINYGEQSAAKEMFAIEELVPISTLSILKEPNFGTDSEAK
uniref:Uncharacterized protein n=1 Tax=Nicotiana tabacum TaxID=4097 RepID=A0A1S4AJ57_TOBAC|nr:PREDICTED: uncharacterized protein LOC107798273 [Nicotiana tabacum]